MADKHTKMNRVVHFGNAMQKITPLLWFDSQAEEAVNFYISIFTNSRILSITRYEEEGAKAAGRGKRILDRYTSKSAAYFDFSSFNFAVRAGKTSL
ncbi:MAG TPA: VOC family protein [Thermodesulfobacteriota bacterium]|nr:VOC family protein [Thermodesulfobacteriota bacterium]